MMVSSCSSLLLLPKTASRSAKRLADSEPSPACSLLLLGEPRKMDDDACDGEEEERISSRKLSVPGCEGIGMRGGECAKLRNDAE